MFRSRESFCEECAKAPVNHAAAYADAAAAVCESLIADSISRIPIVAPLAAHMRTAVSYSKPWLLKLFHILSGGRVNAEYRPEECGVRAAAIWREAERRGMRLEQLRLFGAPHDAFRVLYQGQWVYFENIPIHPARDGEMLSGIADKFYVKRLLIDNGFPCPEGYSARTRQSALDAFSKIRHPAVVKPRIGSNSIHTTLFVTTEEQCEEAFSIAQQISPFVIVEEFVSGHLCRATVVGGKLAGFMCTRQPTVRGDGVHTIRERIDDANRTRRADIADIELSNDNVSFIKRQGYGVDMILEPGVELCVARLPGRYNGGLSEEMLDSVHPGFREQVERAARLLRAPIVGFDLIIPDARKDPGIQRWAFLEANAVPFINLHEDAVSGAKSNVAKAVWDLWEGDQG